MEREFSGSLVVRTLHFHLRGMDLIPGWGAKIPYVVLPGRKIKSTDGEEEAPDWGKAGSHGLQKSRGDHDLSRSQLGVQKNQRY